MSEHLTADDDSAGLPEARPFGAWPSPVTAARIVEGAASVGELRVDGDEIWWSEARPAEGGRTQLVRRDAEGVCHDVLPPGWNVRTQVHEYGGGAWTVRHGVVWFSSWADQRVYRLDTRGGADEPEAITAEPPPHHARSWRYADADVSPDGRWLVCVREAHAPGVEAVNEIVALPAAGEGDPIVLVSGPDFVASPRISPDGTRLAWVQWHHPQMPWDGTELWWAPFPAVPVLLAGEKVAGSVVESIVQPEWTPGGGLLAASDRTGWWNVYRFTGGDMVLAAAEPLTSIDAEIGGPHWVFGQSWYAVLPDGTLAVSVTEDGLTGLGAVGPGSGLVERLSSGFTSVTQVRAVADGEFVVVGAGPRSDPAPFRCRFAAEGMLESQRLRPARELWFEPTFVSVPEPVEFPTTGDRTAHALFYRPTNPHTLGAPDDLPPLLVLSHGGPTSSARPFLDLAKQFWTTRGFAVVDVNYGGSTGYGREYRERLDGHWGIVDVDDCIAAARHLARAELVDPRRLAIRGGSAGGYTTLCALAFHDTFAAGASHYGVADLEALARDTHKFESRYLDGLIGPYPEAVATYRDRSPIHHTEGFNCPLIVLQGLEDEVVPPAQAEMIVSALRHKGVAVAYVPFEEEQHGFRRSENIVRALEAELWFYGQVFGFTPADPVAAVADATGF